MNSSRDYKPDTTRRRWSDWLSIFLLAIILQIAASRLVATEWTKDLRIVQMIAFLGTILGLAIGKSIFGRFWTLYLYFTYGLILIPWQLGLTLDHAISWPLRLIHLYGRLGVVTGELINRKPVTDNLLFLFLMSVLFWTLSVFSGYTLVRDGNPWKTIIPGAITVFIIHSFDPLLSSRTWYLAFYLFFGLILVARMVFLKNTAKWKDNHTHTPPDMGFDFSRIALLLSMVLVFFAWNVPVLAETFTPAAQVWRSASQPWYSFKDRMGFMFASLRASVGLVQNFYGDSLTLGRGNTLSDQVVMEVKAPANLPYGYRFYWQARTYTTYNSNYWQSNINSYKEIANGSEDLSQPGVNSRVPILTTFTPYEAISNLYAVPDPIWINVPAKAYLAVNPDGTINFQGLMSNNFVAPGEQYTVRSSVDAVSISDLKDAGARYPKWVLDQYLQLPDNVTGRTRALAKQIAGDMTDPYDISSAVTQYLRDNIQYSLLIDSPPTNQERIDWFLFDYKKGFCNYYASAEVLLLRSLGIPARMAVGFAQGEEKISQSQAAPEGGDNARGRINETATYIVRQKDAHAWPEVFFPGIGWVIFEPTVAQPPLVRPTGQASTPDTNQNDQSPDGQNKTPTPTPTAIPGDNTSGSNSGANKGFWTFGNIIKSVGLLFAVVLLGIIIWQVRHGFEFLPFLERMSIDIPEGIEKGLRKLGIRSPIFLTHWIYYHRLPGLARSYMEINRALKRVGKEPQLKDTPLERTTALTSVMPAATIPAKQLLAEYQKYSYSPYAADAEVARKAGSEIRNISWLTWLRNILERVQEPRRKY